MELRKVLAAVTLAAALLLVVLVWYLPPDRDFLVENPYWNGVREMAATPLRSLGELPPEPGKTTLVLIPYREPLTQELQALEKFVNSGGTLVLADDYGYGNRVLEYLNLKARFSGEPLLDPLFNYRNPHFPQISRFSLSPLTAGVESLVLNNATSLMNVGNEESLALSSTVSFLDRNGDEQWDQDETSGPFPVLSRHSLGRGWVFLLADPSLFINAMSGLGDNRLFISNLASLSLQLLLDQSLLPPSHLVQARSELAPLRSFLATPSGMAVLALVLLALILLPLRRERKPSWH